MKLNVIVTAALIIVFLVLASTGLIKFLVVKGVIGYEGLPMKDISQIHDCSGVDTCFAWLRALIPESEHVQGHAEEHQIQESLDWPMGFLHIIT
jgi:hypothetical protein